MNASRSLEERLKQSFPHQPTENQGEFFKCFADFLRSNEAIFMLKGYAGTGKTSLLKSVVHTMKGMKIPVVLMAPTGRAAKVMSNQSGKMAFTIHRFIYRSGQAEDGSPVFSLKSNKYKRALFIVDEASMIGADIQDLHGRRLLDDLIEYCFSADGICKLLIVGDTAQLPPVGAVQSPALDIQYLESNYAVDIASIELKQVVRQAVESSILASATVLRECLEPGQDFKITRGKDVSILEDTMEIEEVFQHCFSRENYLNSIVIVRSNKRANAINQAIRASVLYREQEIEAGDLMMITRNNYHWLEEGQGGFLANGDMVEILRIKEYDERYGFRFAKVEFSLALPDSTAHFDAWIHLDLLVEETPSWPQFKMKKLFLDVLGTYAHLSRTKQKEAALKDPFLQALQVKFAYAVTCHKSQGGQWTNVLVERPWLPEGIWSTEDKRWLYTAITRASGHLYLMGFESILYE